MSDLTHLFGNNVVFGKIKGELLDTITNAPEQEPKDFYVFKTLDSLFQKVDWTKTFTHPAVICYDEVLFSELVILLHRWLRKKCANIENITLVVTHQLGITQWWQQWCKVNHEKSFKIKEVPFRFLGSREMWEVPQHIEPNKQTNYFFNFYGGSYASNERQYATLKMLELHKHGIVEFIGTFNSKKSVLAYAEFITYYMNQAEIDRLSTSYDCFVDATGKLIDQITLNDNPQVNEKFFTGHQWDLDQQCFSCVIRETCDNDFYGSLTEKTMRAFCHHQVAIPMGYRSVDNLQKLGFWFPHDIIDYNYQYQPLYAQRVQGLVETLKKSIAKYSNQDLTKFYFDNIEQYRSNAKLAKEFLSNPVEFEKQHYEILTNHLLSPP